MLEVARGDCRELVGVMAKDTIRETSQPPVSGLEATAAPSAASIALAETAASLGATRDGTDRTPKLPGISVGHTLGGQTAGLHSH